MKFVGLLCVFQFLVVESGFALKAPPKGVNSKAFIAETVAKLPGRALSLDLCVALAMKHSDSFKMAMAEAPMAEAYLARSAAPLDWKLFSQLAYLSDATDQASPIFPKKTEVTSVKLGVSRYFSTGTAFDVTLATTNTGQDFAALPPPFSNFTLTSAGFNHSVELRLKQSLWKDAFGSSTRQGMEAGRLMSQSVVARVSAQAEAWHAKMLDLFYQAWQAQNQVRIARLDLEKQDRLAEVTKRRVNRGSSESVDSIQAEGGVLAAKKNLSEAQSQLQQMWRFLLTNLGFSQEWFEVDPELIPIQIEDRSPEAVRICEQTNAIPKNNSLRAMAKEQEAAALQFESVLGRAKPDVYVAGSYKQMGYDLSADTARKELTDGDHPVWSVMVGVEWPLEMNAEKAASVEAFVQKNRAEIQARNAESDSQLDMRNACENMRRQAGLLKDLDLMLKNQKNRARLEEQRFQQGRGSVLQLVQALGDLNQFEFLYVRTLADHRRSAWGVLRLADRVGPYLQDLAQRDWKVQD